MKLIYFVFLSVLVMLTACDRPASPGAQNLLLMFSDQEAEVEAYQTRIIITPEFMRFDDGEGAADFLLFDRKQKTIYSVVQESKSVTVIADQPVDIKPPFDLKLSHKKIDDLKDAPAMEGIKPQHHVYMSGEKVCFEVIAVAGFLPAYVQAMQEFKQILANDAAGLLSAMPADLQNACDLASDIFAPNRYFQSGFPLRKWGPDGEESLLIDYKRDYEPDKALFLIPDGYTRLSIQDIRAGLNP